MAQKMIRMPPILTSTTHPILSMASSHPASYLAFHRSIASIEAINAFSAANLATPVRVLKQMLKDKDAALDNVISDATREFREGASKRENALNEVSDARMKFDKVVSDVKRLEKLMEVGERARADLPEALNSVDRERVALADVEARTIVSITAAATMRDNAEKRVAMAQADVIMTSQLIHVVTTTPLSVV